ncbi:coiled-coil domain-containing protein 117 isoform X1 [Xenopus laevis]|uniref:Coiled-coil domain-containing protein 117 isoform X1 n=2 Tax=Xenopus laevis TaxID=8355 RepID=A0A1L8HQY0_XENLA|nr:coiled-coil domain-containing protein 117 isoform X1 [Xenopus laevis]OCT98477.1 hypothetical protein XELAEV_18010711mg [Xenopus laevis]
MAAVGSPFNGMLFRMDFGQSSDSFYQSASLQSPMDNPFLSANMNNDNPVNPAPMGSSVNFDNTYYNKYSLCNSSPSLIGGGLTPFMRNALLSANSESGVGYFASCSGFSHSTRNKHKREEDITECPLKKRRISEHAKVSVFPEPTACHSSADILKGEISRSCWDSNCKAEITAAIQYSESDVLSEMHLAQSEEMEEASSEFFSPACGNDHRLSSANEELETDKKADCLPSLILSDVLKEGLKRGFEESLTKKIVDSMNRPSMELVLWKPQSEFLIDRLQAVPKNRKKEKDSEKPSHSASKISFIQEVETIEDVCRSNTTSAPNRTWSRDEEEEMEL